MTSPDHNPKNKSNAASSRRAFRDADVTWPEKAYKNATFLNSADARLIRLMCEYLEPQSRLRMFGVRHTIVFYGSARALGSHSPVKDHKLHRYYDDAAELAERLTKWTLDQHTARRQYVICSGGGPGIMEAANLGARRGGGRSMGLNISLPFEQEPNAYQDDELSFEFHYFFMRKFWFVYLAKALVVFPGGFGTMDELFELLTLVQTQKTAKKMPIVVYGEDFWRNVVNFEALADWGVISPEDLELFRIHDDVDSAFEYITSELDRLRA